MLRAWIKNDFFKYEQAGDIPNRELLLLSHPAIRAEIMIANRILEE